MACELIDRQSLKNINRVMVKVGSSTLSHPTGRLNIDQMERLVRQLADLHNSGKEVVLVSSGAQSAGIGKLGLTRKPKTMPKRQAVAAIGQGLLMHMYEKLFSEYGIIVAQVLITREDIMDRGRFLNARNALNALLQLGTIPIINENDTIATDELKFGDNDTLSAMLASLIDSELLLVLSDIEGLYTGNPKTNPNAKLIPEVSEINCDIEKLAGGTGSKLGTGGMVTKIQAARVATNSGIPMIIAQGKSEKVITRIINGEQLGTLFMPKDNRLHSKKLWIAIGSNITGKIYVDEGAKKALQEKGKSLLPSGVIDIAGEFEIGHTVDVYFGEEKIGRGVVNYSSNDALKIMGKKTGQIQKILGHKDFDEIIHRNNFVLSC